MHEFNPITHVLNRLSDAPDFQIKPRDEYGYYEIHAWGSSFAVNVFTHASLLDAHQVLLARKLLKDGVIE